MTRMLNSPSAVSRSGKTRAASALYGIGAVAVAALTVLGGTERALACPVEPYIASVCFMATNYCPQGYVSANGQLLSVAEYQAVFGLIGTTYGGDGRSTFGVPDLRGRAPIGVAYGSIVTGGTSISAVSLGTMRGNETATLQVANLPPVGSSGGPAQVMATTNTATTRTPSNTVQFAASESTTAGPDAVTTNIYAPIGGTQVALGGVSGGGSSAGGTSAPFRVIEPQLALTACFATTGQWPPRP